MEWFHLFLLLLNLFTLIQSRTYPPPHGLTTQIPVSQMPVGEATVFGPEH